MAVFTPSHEMPPRDVSQPGEVCWHELMTAEHEGAFVFYNKLFGWKKSRDFDMGAMGKYLLFGNGGADMGGMFTKRKEVPVSAWLLLLPGLRPRRGHRARQGRRGSVYNGPDGGSRRRAHRAAQRTPKGVMFALPRPRRSRRDSADGPAEHVRSVPV